MKKILTILFLLIAAESYAQSPMFIDSVRSNDTWPDLREYALTYLPANYDPAKRYPLILFFHGAGESGTTKADLSKIYNSTTAGGPAYLITHGQWPDSFFNYKDGKYYQPIVICPQAGGDWSTNYTLPGLIIQELLTRYSIDTNRIYMTGLSAGGWTIWNYSGHFQVTPIYKAAAIVPMSMATTPTTTDAGYIASDSVHVWGFGDVSGDSWGAATQNGVNLVNDVAPGLARFTNTPGTGHGGWNLNYDPTYKETIDDHDVNIYQWMLYWTRGTDAIAATSNDPPTVNAGSDQSQYYPDVNVDLSGSATDDHNIVSHSWSTVSSPDGTTPKFDNANDLNVVVTGLDSIGNYTFQLSATDDSGATATDNVVITIEKPTHIGNRDTVLWPDTYSALDLEGADYEPGDTIFIGPTTYSLIRLNDFRGTPDNPIVVMPLHAPVTISQYTAGAAAGIHLNGCQYVHIDGSLTDTAYGFNMIGTANRWPQCFIYGRSKNIEVNGIYGHEINYGFQIKNDPTCDTISWNDDEASAFVIDSINLHNFYFDSTSFEGTYIGGTLNTSKDSYGTHGGYRVVCGGDTSYHFAYRMGHIKIHDGVIENTGDDGIQCVDVRFGGVEIYNMRLLNIGAGSGSYQNHGMSLGGYMQADIHDNYIDHAGMGIFLNGQGDITIRNDTIKNISDNDGMYISNNVDTLYQVLAPDSMILRIHDNIIDSTNWGINITNYDKILDFAQIYGNTITNSVDGSLNHNNDATIKWQGQFSGSTLDTSLGSRPWVLISSVDTSGNTLTIHANSSPGTTIKYSVNGTTWQTDSVFTGLDQGYYIASAEITGATRDNHNQVYIAEHTAPVVTGKPKILLYLFDGKLISTQ